MSKPLDYLRSSPVRGQLDPYDPKAPVGWRFVQTTDTLNELKVLIPPRTAAMYEQLLKLENYELTKKSISWDRILEIRHLKDRMIRKCQKIAKATTPSPSSPPPFQTFIAPEDFRVKQMEKWFGEQQKRVNAITARRTSAQTPAAQAPIAAAPSHNHVHAQCVHCISGQTPRSLPPAGKLSASKSNLQQSVNSTPALKILPKPGMYTQTQALVNASRAIKPERAHSLPANQTRLLSSTRPSVVSPPPLPVLLRGQRSEFGLDDELGQPESAQGDPVRSEYTEDETTLPAEPKESTKDENRESKYSPQSSGDETPLVPGEVRRRRSCIKNGNMSELGAKTVSWADNQEWDHQISRYASAARDVQASGNKWEEIRTIYLDQMNGLGDLQERVREGLESLKTESDHLHRVDDTIRRHREQLRRTFDELERTQNLFNEKVQEALEQAHDVMSRHDLSKNSHLIATE